MVGFIARLLEYLFFRLIIRLLDQNFLPMIYANVCQKINWGEKGANRLAVK